MVYGRCRWESSRDAKLNKVPQSIVTGSIPHMRTGDRGDCGLYQRKGRWSIHTLPPQTHQTLVKGLHTKRLQIPGILVLSISTSPRACFTKRGSSWLLRVKALRELKYTKTGNGSKGHGYRMQRSAGSASTSTPSKNASNESLLNYFSLKHYTYYMFNKGV